MGICSEEIGRNDQGLKLSSRVLPSRPPCPRGHHGTVTTRALSFGSVASAYEQFRPDYPDELSVRNEKAFKMAPVRT